MGDKSMGIDHIDLREIHQVGPDSSEQRVGPEAAPALAAFAIRRVGITDAGRGYAFAKAAPPLSHVVACIAGLGEVLVDGAWRRLGPGEAYLTPPDRPHAFRTLPGRRWSICWVTYSEAAALELPGAVAIETDPEPLRAAIQGLWRETVGAADEGILAQWAALAHAQAQRLARSAPGHSRLWALWRAVDAVPARPWSLGQLARLAGVGPEQLRRLCLRHHRRSPMRQVALVRMRRAAALLAAGGITVARAARAVGYENPFAFSSAFKRVIGTSPSTIAAH